MESTNVNNFIGLIGSCANLMDNFNFPLFKFELIFTKLIVTILNNLLIGKPPPKADISAFIPR